MGDSGDELLELLPSVDCSANDGFTELPLELQLERQPYQDVEQSAPLPPVTTHASSEKTRKGSDTSGGTRKRKSNSNKARDGRKEELAYLRRNVAELETRLQVLSQLSTGNAAARCEAALLVGHSRDSNATTLGWTCSNDSVDERTSLWCEIARRQSDERYQSERENVRLRVMLESQLKVARSLERFLQLKSAASTTKIGNCINVRSQASLSELSARPKTTSRTSTDMQFAQHGHHVSEAAIFEALVVSVEQLIAEVDVVFEVNGLARITTTQINAQMRLDPGDADVRVEICATKALPFDVHVTGAAAWNHYRFAKQRMPLRYYTYMEHKSLDSTEDTVVENFTLELHAKSTLAHLRVRQVMRRSVEANRVVIVWRSFFDPFELSQRRVSGLRFSQKSYIVIRPAPSSSFASSAETPTPHTLLQPFTSE